MSFEPAPTGVGSDGGLTRHPSPIAALLER